MHWIQTKLANNITFAAVVTGLYFALEYPIDLAVVDLGLPEMSGLEVIREVRDKGKTYPILILTARDRWQEHLKTRGEFYHDRAKVLEQMHTGRPEVGADTAALAMHAMAEVMERCRTARLTRNQHVLFRLGELIAWAECAGASDTQLRGARDRGAETCADGAN